MKTDLRDYSKAMDLEESTDPILLLKSLAPLLSLKGGINGLDEASKIVGSMRSSKKLVGRCIYLSILGVTTDEIILKKFLLEGGWKILNKWLSEAKDTDNTPVLHEIMKLLHKLPITIQHLRENNTPKIIKHYAKSSNQKLKSSATSLMTSWMAIIRGSSGPLDSEQPKKKEKKSKAKIKDSTAIKNKQKIETGKLAPPPVMKAPSFAKFRKTGLETEQQPISKKKSKTKPVTTTGKRNSVDNDNGIPEKKLKPTVDIKPKKITISEGFMDALNSASNPVILPTKKIKRRPLKPLSGSGSDQSNSTKSNMDYATGDADDFSAAELLRKLSPKGNRSPKSPVPVEPVKPKLNKFGKPMKSVRFAAEELLTSIRYFEVNENERVNVSTQSFKDAQHREMMIERQLMKGGKIHIEDSNGLWHRPASFDGLEFLVVAGCNSVEKDIQTEREKTVLMSIFLTKEMVPDSPSEPDPEPYEITQPKLIPFDDENSIVESMEPEAEGNASSDVMMKNVISGIQTQDGADLTEKLKQILQSASAITKKDENTSAQNPAGNMQQPVTQMQPMMMYGNAQGNTQMTPLDMNGQPMQPQMGFYGAPMMMPMHDPNFYGPAWNGPPPPHHNGPPMPHQGGPPPGMVPPGPGGPQYNNYNQGWNEPRWQRGGPRHEFRGNWRGRYNDRRR